MLTTPRMSQRVFVTGGASGLGRAIALRFAKAGARVCIGDLNEERGAQVLGELKAIAPGAQFMRCDVTKEEDLVAVREWVEKTWGGLDVLINNAGVAQAGAIENVSLDDWRWIIDINLLGVVRGCRVFVPGLKRQRAGHIVNVASMAGLLDVPQMSSYNATKAAVVSLSETLQNELSADGIGVSVVCPSFFKTNLGESLRTTEPGMKVAMDKLLSRSAIGADDVAEDVFQAVEHKRFYVLSHRQAQVAWVAKRLLPRSLYTRLLTSQMPRLKR